MTRANIRTIATGLAFLSGSLHPVSAANEPPSPQLTALNAYFEQQVSAIEGQLEREIKTKEDWLAKKDE